MNLTKKLLLAVLLIMSANLFAKEEGGDDAGNGGFAYKQSIKILKMATEELEKKIIDSDLKDLTDYPERRAILQKTLKYDNLRKLYFWNQYRNGRKLAMNYDVKPQRVTVLKPYYVAFSGKTDSELEDASLEVQKRLLHEASHIWGYNEEAAEKFSIVFLADADGGSKRPTNAIEIKSDFCSCLNGRSDIINDCESFCASKPISDQPILYVNTLLGAEITMHPKLGTLYNWCTVQLSNDATTPQCVLNAYDGSNEINIPVSVNPGSNSFIANINSLAKNRTWILKLVETKTGSNAQTKEFQVRRKTQSNPDDLPLGALKIAPINQYSCLVFGGKIDSIGNVIRTTFARLFYYFPSYETPAPIPPSGGINQSMVVCHDEQRYPGADSAQYERLELIPGLFNMWDKADPRFMVRSPSAEKILMNKILEDRLADEYGMNVNLNLFYSMKYPNRPTSSSNGSHITQGYAMVPFVNNTTGRSFCPTSSDYAGSQPLFSVLGDYMDDTEALYLAEREAETLMDGTTYKTIYGTMLITESQLYGKAFYMENGLKILADKNSFHLRTIYYYWPASSAMDPLIQGNRKLFTIRTPDSLNGTSPLGHSTIERTSDKRIACVPMVRK